MWKTCSILIVTVLSLMILGVVIVYSTSGGQGEVLFGDSLHYLKRQLLWMLIGLVLALACWQIHYSYWRVLAVPLAVFSLLLLVMVILPSVGVEINGSRRWLRFGPLNFQPSELAKLALIVLLASWMGHCFRRAQEFRRGLVVPLVMLAPFAGLILREPDYGTTMLVSAVALMVMFMGGTRLSYLVVTGLSGLLAFGLLIAHNPVRRMRVLAFLDPDKYADDHAYQLVQALVAFVRGGSSGVGLGQSLQKREYLPEAHTDFIFAILGEEIGFPGTFLVMVLFVVLLLCGLYISRRAVDPFGRLLGFGITSLITLQAALNIGVVTGSLPTKGIALPFVSFGGSSLVMTLAMVGILLNIARNAADPFDREEDRIIKDRPLDL